jgi:hypothetical protein
LETPEPLSGFTLTLKYVYNAGYSADSGTRVFFESCDSNAAVKKRIQEKSSETLVMGIVGQELTRIDNFINSLGFLNTVSTLE